MEDDRKHNQPRSVWLMPWRWGWQEWRLAIALWIYQYLILCPFILSILEKPNTPPWMKTAVTIHYYPILLTGVYRVDY